MSRGRVILMFHLNLAAGTRRLNHCLASRACVRMHAACAHSVNDMTLLSAADPATVVDCACWHGAVHLLGAIRAFICTLQEVRAVRAPQDAAGILMAYARYISRLQRLRLGVSLQTHIVTIYAHIILLCLTVFYCNYLISYWASRVPGTYYVCCFFIACVI